MRHTVEVLEGGNLVTVDVAHLIYAFRAGVAVNVPERELGEDPFRERELGGSPLQQVRMEFATYKKAIVKTASVEGCTLGNLLDALSETAVESGGFHIECRLCMGKRCLAHETCIKGCGCKEFVGSDHDALELVLEHYGIVVPDYVYYAHTHELLRDLGETFDLMMKTDSGWLCRSEEDSHWDLVNHTFKVAVLFAEFASGKEDDI
jgi:hypothetical protein